MTVLRDVRVSLQVEARHIRATLFEDGRQTASGLSTDPVGTLAAEVQRAFGNPAKVPSTVLLKKVGKKLARAAFPNSIIDTISARTTLNRFRLWIDPQDDDLASLPWEFAWLEEAGPLACHPLVVLLRGSGHSDIPVLPEPDETKVLISLADPGTRQFPPLLDSRSEAGNLENLFKKAGYRCQLRLGDHKKGFLRAVGEFRPDIVHFIGHGVETASGGGLVFESDNSSGHSILYGEDLAKALNEANTRLAVLSGCLTSGSVARVSGAISRLTGCATVGMQLPIRDATAAVFSPNFYIGLLGGDSVDIAAHKARSSIRGCHHEWGIPTVTLANARTERQPAESPAPSKSAAGVNYPADLRPLVGRGKERASLWSRLRSPEVRLLTLFSMGGMGKTRLAKELGQDLQYEFADGVRLVECDSLHGRDEIVEAIAKACGVEDRNDLAGSLADSELLLILDCFETHVSHAALLQNLLQSTRRLKILVTSRIILDLPAVEHTFELEGLSNEKKKTSRQSSARAALFAQAACQSQPNFAITPANSATVEALTDLLQGVPLAILLAAGRLRHVTLEELYSRLQVCLLDELKRSTKRQDRHASIRIVVKDSFVLLSDREKALAKQLSVFAGGFTLADAKAVFGQDAEIEDGISNLFDQSFLASVDLDSERRFFELDTVREFMREQALGVALDLLEQRHACYFAAKAGHIHALFRQGRDTEANAQLWRDIGNFRQAVRKAKQIKDPDLLSQLARFLSRPFMEAGLQADFAAMAVAAEKLAREREDFPLLIELRGLQGALAARKGDRLGAELLWIERARFCALAGDLQAELETYLDIANSALRDERPEKSEEMICLFWEREAGLASSFLRATSYLIQAQLHLRREQFSLALDCADQAKAEPDQGDYYVWITLARVYRAASRPLEGVPYCRRFVAKAIDTNYAHYACVGLLELSECWGDSAPAALKAAQIARWISKRAAPNLTPRAMSRCTALESTTDASQVFMAPKGLTDWRLVAKPFLEGDARN